MTMDWVDETATASRPYTYQFDDLDMIVLEGRTYSSGRTGRTSIWPCGSIAVGRRRWNGRSLVPGGSRRRKPCMRITPFTSRPKRFTSLGTIRAARPTWSCRTTRGWESVGRPGRRPSRA